MNRKRPIKSTLSLFQKVDKAYECKIKNPPKAKMLKAIKCTVMVKGYWLEGFTRNKAGKDIPNGIKVFVPEGPCPPGSTVKGGYLLHD